MDEEVQKAAEEGQLRAIERRERNGDRMQERKGKGKGRRRTRMSEVRPLRGVEVVRKRCIL